MITNLFSSLDAVIPVSARGSRTWLWGGFAVGASDAERGFYALHYLCRS